MYEYIIGKVILKENNKVVLENNGIGYGIQTSNKSLDDATINEKIIFHTYLHVKEDAFLLYGFSNKEELILFKMLISISGVGPKATLSILSTLSPNKFALTIATNNDKELSKAKGIGKKTAQRIILELKDKFKSIELLEENEVIDNSNLILEEAKMALMVLGYKASNAIKVINKIYIKGDMIEDIIKKALNKMEI